MTLKIGITGHRKLEDPNAVRQRIKLAIEETLQSKNKKSFEAYTCLASGSDSLFAEVALELDGTLKVVLPLHVSEYQNDFDNQELITFNDLLKHDSTPEIIKNNVPANAEGRNEAYLKAGESVVNRCDLLIAVWDGEKSNGKGGTADIVSYAKKTGKKVIHIKEYRSDISRLFWENDTLAIRYKTIYERLWILSISLSLLAALILAVFLSFELKKQATLLATIEFITVAIAFVIILYLKLSKLNKNRVSYRRTAERLRVIEKFDSSGINIEKLEEFDGLESEVIELEKKYEKIHYSESNFEKSRKTILHLIEEQLIYHSNSRPEIKGEKRRFHFLESKQFPLLVLFFLGVLVHFIAVFIEDKNGHLYHILHPIGLMLSLSIPPIYAAIEGYIYFKEYHKIFTDSEKMTSFFEGTKEAINKIDASKGDTFTLLNNYAFQIMEKMDAETKEWVVWFGRTKTPGP